MHAHSLIFINNKALRQVLAAEMSRFIPDQGRGTLLFGQNFYGRNLIPGAFLRIRTLFISGGGGDMCH